MNRILLALLALALLAVPVGVAQTTPGVTVESHQIDIVETSDGLDARETLDVVATTGFDGNLTVRVPRMTEALAATITRTEDGASVDVPQEQLVLQNGGNAAGQPFVRIAVWDVAYNGTPQDAHFAVTLSYSAPGSATYTKALVDGTSSLVLLATPRTGSEVRSLSGGQFIPTGEGSEQHLVVSDAPAGYVVNVHFQPGSAASSVEDMTKYVWGAAGLLAGLFVMYVLVKQGWVSIHRAKRFEKGGTMESSTMLEARRRTLMAALKELETAHDAKEVPDDAYAPLKEEYKSQAVRVLRSLEGKKDEPKA